ncbi:MAG: biotin/lipoyl-containing protein, partial [Candidatus Dormibacteraceae bacterium]
ITVRPADLLEPEVEATRDALLKAEQTEDRTEATGSAAIPPADGDILHAILFPELAAGLRGSRRALAMKEEAEAEEEVIAGAEAAGEGAGLGEASPPAVAGSPQTAELQVEVEGEVFTVRVSGAGLAVTPGAFGSAAGSGDGAPAAVAPAVALQNAVTAPMQGLIIKIPVEVGTEVQLGDVVAVLEAMKMQNDIVANRAGKVSQILVKEQDVVSPEQPLLAIE